MKFKSFLASHDVTHRFSSPHTPEQNGLVESRHRRIVETRLTLMTCALGPTMFWSDAFQTTCYLLNKIPSQVLQNKTPLECLFKTPPDYLHMRVFGWECFPHIRPYNAHKLISRSLHCIFLGYSSLHGGYKCLHLPTNRLNISRYIVFNKDLFPFVAAQQEHSHP